MMSRYSLHLCAALLSAGTLLTHLPANAETVHTPASSELLHASADTLVFRRLCFCGWCGADLLVTSRVPSATPAARVMDVPPAQRADYGKLRPHNGMDIVGWGVGPDPSVWVSVRAGCP